MKTKFTGLKVTLFRIHWNPFDGKGFSLLTIGYTLTNVGSSSYNPSFICINRVKNALGLPGVYDTYLWMYLFFGLYKKKLFYKKYRPTLGIYSYDDWLSVFKTHLINLGPNKMPNVSMDCAQSRGYYYKGMDAKEAAQDYFDYEL